MTSQRGFTLLELSIVLAIIGLITASLVGGKALIRQAEIQGVISQVNSFKVAINAFILEYDALPGDFKDATDYWGDITEDGNGDSIIQEKGWGGEEGIRAWQHLVLAEILPGNFNGVGKQEAGETIPASKINGGGFYFRSRPKTLLHSGIDKPFIEWGLCLTNGPEECHGGIVDPPEGRLIDRKMDDGFATTGSVFGYNGMPEDRYTHCSGKWNSPVGSVDYQVIHQEKRDCRMNFWIF